MSQSIKETAVPSAVRAYANHLIWAAVIIASLLIWAVMGNRGDLEAKYVTAKVNAAGMLMGQVEDGTWTIIGQIDRDSARVAAFGRGYNLGESEGRYAGYDSAVKRIHDSLSRIPKPRKATLADFETDAERARRLDSAAKDPLGIFDLGGASGLAWLRTARWYLGAWPRSESRVHTDELACVCRCTSS